MLKQTTKLMLAAILLSSVAFVSCNNESDKKAETPAADSMKVETPAEKMAPATPATPDSATKTIDTTGVTKPIVPGK